MAAGIRLSRRHTPLGSGPLHVMEAGHYTLADGTQLEAGSRNSQLPCLGTVCRIDSGIRYEVATTSDRVTHEATTVEFSNSFNQTPLVVTDMQTTDGGDTSALRTLQVSSLDLQVTVEEEQSKDSEIYHTSEDAGFIAIQVE